MNSKSAGQLSTQIKDHIKHCPKCIPGIYYCPEKREIDNLLDRASQGAKIGVHQDFVARLAQSPNLGRSQRGKYPGMSFLIQINRLCDAGKIKQVSMS